MTPENHKDESGDLAAKRALLRFMTAKGLKAGPLAKIGGFSASSIYNLEAGRAEAPSGKLLEKIAAAAGATVAEIMSYAEDPGTVVCEHVIVTGGRIVVGNVIIETHRPATVDPSLDLKADLVVGDGLHPIPDGWFVLYSERPSPAGEVIDQLCRLRLRGLSDPIYGKLLQGRTPGTFDVAPWHGPTRTEVEVLAAHLVVCIQPPR